MHNFLVRSMKHITALLVIAALLSSCMDYDFSKREVQQGNLLSPKKINRLHIGMTKDDVIILMGSSLISPLFNNNRLDYAYLWHRGNGPTVKRHLVVYFNAQDRVCRIEKT